MPSLKRTLILAFICMAALLPAAPVDDALLDAAGEGNIEAMKARLDEGANVNARSSYGATGVLLAARKGNLQAVKLLVERGGDVNARDTFYGVTPLTSAAQAGSAEIVRYLLEKGASGVQFALTSAIRAGKPEVARAVIESGKLNGPQLNAALRLATQSGRDEIVAMLAKAGATAGPPSDFKLSDAEMNGYTGSYKNWRGQKVSVTRESDKFFISGDGIPRAEFKPLDKANFAKLGDNASRFAFELEQDRAQAFTLFAPGADPLVFVREDASLRPQLPADSASSEIPKVEKPLNWAQFRGDHASGVADTQFPPVVWDAPAGRNLAWKTPIPGLGHSCPIVWGNMVFVTTAVSGKPTEYFRHGLYGDVDSVEDNTVHNWKVFALDKRTGKILWEQTAHEGVPKQKRHMKSTHANSTPVTDGERLVVFFGSEGLYSYALDGKLNWKKDLGSLDSGWFYDPDVQWGFASSPILYKNLIIVQCDVQKTPFIAAFEAKTGDEVWRTSRHQEIPSWGTPTLVEAPGRAELVTNATKLIRAYDPLTGNELWTLSGNSEVTAPTPIFAEGLIFVTSGYRPIQPIYAIRPGGNGDITPLDGKDRGDFIAWSTKKDGPYMPTPIAYRGLLYTCSNNGVLSCYDAKSGERKYKSRLGHMGGGYSASPVAADGRIYFTGEDGDVNVIEAGPEYKPLATNPIGEICMATPAISDGMIFIRSLAHLYGFAQNAKAVATRSQ